MQLIEQKLLRQLAHEAMSTGKKRAHCKIYGMSGKFQYVVNALQPGTYIRPHRHPASFWKGISGSEFLVVLSGKCALVLLHATGHKNSRHILDAASGIRAAEVPENVFHTVLALSPHTVVLEIIQHGRRTQMLEKAPMEGTDCARQLLRLWTAQLKR